MLLKKWEALPAQMQTPEVQKYYNILSKKRGSLLLKRCFDIAFSLVLLILLSPVFLILSIAIALDSPGGVLYRQKRVTAYGRVFRIHKFRTMVAAADRIGTQVTVGNDSRITRIGKKLRKLRLDELPQLIDVLRGDMSFVGTRPEVEKYVARYTPEMWATLLLPAGITSEASIRYKNESELLQNAMDADQTYITQILPQKMEYNLSAVAHFSLSSDLKTMFRTVFAVIHPDSD